MRNQGSSFIEVEQKYQIYYTTHEKQQEFRTHPHPRKIPVMKLFPLTQLTPNVLETAHLCPSCNKSKKFWK